MNPQYVVKLCTKAGKPYGVAHGADEDSSGETLCGRFIDEGYYITHNNFDGKVTCPICLKIMKEREIHEQSSD